MTVISLSGYAASAGEYSELAFASPAGTTVAQAQFWRNAWSYGSGTGASSKRNYANVLATNAGVSGGSDADGTVDVAYGTRGTPDVSQHGIVPANLMTLNPSSLAASSIQYRVGCGWSAGCPTASPSGPPPNYFASGVDVFGTRITIQDPTSPSLTVGDSGVLASGPQSGTRPLLVTQASDVSGIKKLAVFADGGSTPIGVLDFEQDVNRCDWSKPAPCQNITDTEIPVDTRQLTDGEHALVVKAFDAADNEKPSTTRYVTIKNSTTTTPTPIQTPPPGNNSPDGGGLPNGLTTGDPGAGGSMGSPALAVTFDQNGKASVKAKYGRMIAVRGRLTDGAGAPIADAQVDYTALSSRAGARTQNLGAVRTDSTGAFRLTVATKLGSRRLRFAYSPQIGGAIAISAQAQLDVMAPVTLKVGPKHVRNKHAVLFRGKLGAGPIPRKGKLVNLQVVVDGRWHTFATVRSSKSGKFKYRYRFTRTYGRVTYRFRALSRYEAAYPFIAGNSKTVRLRVN
jgi:hypothetical protein